MTHKRRKRRLQVFELTLSSGREDIRDNPPASRIETVKGRERKKMETSQKKESEIMEWLIIVDGKEVAVFDAWDEADKEYNRLCKAHAWKGRISLCKVTTRAYRGQED